MKTSRKHKTEFIITGEAQLNQFKPRKNPVEIGQSLAIWFICNIESQKSKKKKMKKKIDSFRAGLCTIKCR